MKIGRRVFTVNFILSLREYIYILVPVTIKDDILTDLN